MIGRVLAGLALCAAFSGAAVAEVPVMSSSAPVMTGTHFAESTASASGRERQRLAVEQLVGGNVPEFLRELESVAYEAADRHGVVHAVEVRVLRDYLAIGSEGDFLRVPLDLPSAKQVARAWGMALPTTKLVDVIYDGAPTHLDPRPMPPGPQMRSSGYYLQHRELLRAQGAGAPSEALVAGHKKDVVLTRRLVEQPDRIAIYGWHRLDGRPIQGLTLIHVARYADYSHGIRLVAPEVDIDGISHDLFAVLADPELAPLVSSEGPIPEARQLLWSD